MASKHSPSQSGQTMADPEGAQSSLHWLICRLECIGNLSESTKQMLLDLPTYTRTFEANQDIVREGDRPTESCAVIEGFAGRYKTGADGQRQILSFHIAGDMPNLHSLYLTTLDDSVAAFVPTKVAFVPHAAIDSLVRSDPSVAIALWRLTLVDASILREWILGLGRRSAYQRIAHLLCEMALRFKQVGLGDERGYSFPITQSELGDAIGISTVHANRVVQELRRSELITWLGSTVTILDWDGLKKAADFDPAYLHQQFV